MTKIGDHEVSITLTLGELALIKRALQNVYAGKFDGSLTFTDSEMDTAETAFPKVCNRIEKVERKFLAL